MACFTLEIRARIVVHRPPNNIFHDINMHDMSCIFHQNPRASEHTFSTQFRKSKIDIFDCVYHRAVCQVYRLLCEKTRVVNFGIFRGQSLMRAIWLSSIIMNKMIQMSRIRLWNLFDLQNLRIRAKWGFAYLWSIDNNAAISKTESTEECPKWKSRLY